MSRETLSSSGIERYNPSRNEDSVALHIASLMLKPKEDLTNTDCLQAIADVATLYGATEPGGITIATLPVNGRRHIRVDFNEWDQELQDASILVFNKIPEKGRKTYRIENIYSFSFETDIDAIPNQQALYVDNGDNITPKMRSQIIKDLSKAFSKRAQRTS